ncbi:hypothetical protein [Geomesophilobacter sediminis]|nr:hypothetical protein [Geomesophilobacter sediminis]
MITFYLTFLAASSVMAVSYQLVCLTGYRKEKVTGETKACAVAC